MGDSLRPIEPLPDEREDSWPTDYGGRPELLWANPTDLFVDDAYQRDINRRSLALIRRIVLGFSWRKFKVPNCTRVGDRLHVTDGQHSAIAAATLGIGSIPICVVATASEMERADSFVAINQDRLTMTTLDLHRGQVAAGHSVSLQVDRVCKHAGLRLKVISKFGNHKPGDTASIGSIRSLVVRRGPAVAQSILSAFVSAGRGPISSAEIEAADVAWHHSGRVCSVVELSAAIRSLGDDGLNLAKIKATTDKVATKVVLASEYRRLLPRRAA